MAATMLRESSCVRIDWYVVPWGALPGDESCFRYGLRAMPAICEPGHPGAVPLDALLDWPSWVASVRTLKLTYGLATNDAKDIDEFLGDRYTAYLDSINVTLADASKIWTAAVGGLVAEIMDMAKGGPLPKPDVLTGLQRPNVVKAHCSGCLAQETEVRIADLLATSLVQSAPDGAPGMVARHGVVRPAALGGDTSSSIWLRTTAAMYQSVNQPSASFAAIVKDAAIAKANTGYTTSWAYAALNAMATAQEKGAAGAALKGSDGHPVDSAGPMSYSKDYLTYVLSNPVGNDSFKFPRAIAKPLKDVLVRRDGKKIDDFVKRLSERRIVYASASLVPSKQGRAAAATANWDDGKLEALTNELLTTIASLVSHTWLAKLLGVTVDASAQVQGKVTTIAWVEATALCRKGDMRSTNIVCRMRSMMKDGFPWSKLHETSYACGVLNVTARNEAFMLTQLDVDRAPEKYVQAAVSYETQLLTGQTSDDIDAQMPPQETVGLSLIELGEDRRLALHCERGKCKEGVNEVYLEHLLLGYRPDVQASDSPFNGAPCARRWRSLNGRCIVQLRSSTFALDCVSRIAQCEGFLPERTRITPKTDEKTQQSAFIEGELFRWSTHGLAGSSQDEGNAQGLCLNSGTISRRPKDLTIEYQPANLPPQRFKHCYRVGVRLAMIDGNSLSLEEATLRYDGDKNHEPCSIGDGLDSVDSSGNRNLRGVRLARFEPVLPPDVLLIDAPAPHVFPRDALHHVVVASGARVRSVAWRVLVPPRAASQDLCLRHGRFDAFYRDKDWPPSAFGDIELTHNGHFPMEPKVEPGRADKTVQEPYFRPRRASTAAPVVRYYPDPWAERAVLGFFRVGDDRLMHVEWLDFYDDAHHWPNCRAWRLCVQTATQISDMALGFDVVKSADVLTVRLPKGMQVKLRMWHEMDADKLSESAVVDQMVRLAGQPHVGQEVRGLLNRGLATTDDTDVMRDRMIECLSRWERNRNWTGGPPRVFRTASTMVNVTSFWMINPSVDVDLVHAIDRPCFAPYAVQDSAANPHAFSMKRAAGQTAVSFAGDIWLDRPTTGKIEAFACWKDNPTRASAIGKTGRYEAVPKISNARLFEVKDIAIIAADCYGKAPVEPLPQTLPDQHLQRLDPRPQSATVKLQDAKPASKPPPAPPAQPKLTAADFDFTDTRARAIDLQLSGTSRFDDDIANLSTSEAKSASGRVRMIVQGSKRPDPPGIEYVMPVFSWTDTTSSLDQVGRRREAGWFRVWLGSWYSSGNGELLAFVCLPKDTTSLSCKPRNFLCGCDPTGDFSSPLTAFEPSITRWGLDPVARQDMTFGNMHVDAFSNRLQQPSDLCALDGPPALAEVDEYHLQDMVCPRAEDMSRAFEPTFDLALLPEFTGARTTQPGSARLPSQIVQLALYRPTLDTITGRFFVDVHVDPGQAYQPFVRLAMARYQFHGLDDGNSHSPAYKLSPVVTTEFVQLLPERAASFVVRRMAGGDIASIDITVCGASLPAQGSPHSRFLASVEERQLNFATTAGDEPDGAWVPARHASAPAALQYDLVCGVPTWTTSLPLRTRVAHEYSIRIEEYEVLPGDSDVDGRLVYFDRLNIRDL